MSQSMEVESEKYQRTIEDLKTVIGFAKIDGKQLTEVSQALYFRDIEDLMPTSVANSDLKLLELNKDLLKEIEVGNIITFKGGLNDKVCLCTRDKTYEVRNAEQSNSLVVIPDLLLAQKTSVSPIKSPVAGAINKSLDKSLEDEEESSSQQDNCAVQQIQHKPILKVFYNYLEPREVKPNLKKIQEMLQMTLYNGPENEHMIEKKHLFTRRQLFECSQCSAAEFDNELSKIRAVKVDGFLRLLDRSYEFRLVTFFTNMINENSWELDEVDKEQSLGWTDGIFPLEIAETIFNYYANEVPTTGKYQYNEEMVCRIIAQVVLQEGQMFHIDEFMETCSEGLPSQMTMQDSYLHGLCVIDRDSQQPNIRGLFEENLPLSLLERLRALFRFSKSWTLPQISPYLEVFTSSKQPITALLAKYTRSMNENGVRYYFSKH